MNLFALLKKPFIRENKKEGSLEIIYSVNRETIKKIEESLDRHWNSRSSHYWKDINEELKNEVLKFFRNKIEWDELQEIVKPTLEKITKETIRELEKLDWLEITKAKIIKKFLE